MLTLRIDWNTLRPYVAFVLAGALLLLFIRFVWPVTVPFFLALTLAVLIEGPVSALERRRVPRSLAVLVILSALLLLLALLAIYGSAALASELSQLSRSLPSLWQGFIATTQVLQQRLEGLAQTLPPEAGEYLAHQQEAVLAWLVATVGKLVDTVQRWALQGVPGGAITLMITGLATYLMSRDKAGILAFLPRLLPPRWRPRAVQATGLFVTSALGFINAVIILVSITALLTTAGLRLLGSPYAVLLGAMAGVLDLIPILGPGLIFIPWALYHLFFGEPAFSLSLFLLYGVLTVARTVLESRIISSRTGIHPLTALIALYVGLQLFGMAGFIIGPLWAILLRSLAQVGILTTDGDGEA